MPTRNITDARAIRFVEALEENQSPRRFKISHKFLMKEKEYNSPVTET